MPLYQLRRFLHVVQYETIEPASEPKGWIVTDSRQVCHQSARSRLLFDRVRLRSASSSGGWLTLTLDSPVGPFDRIPPTRGTDVPAALKAGPTARTLVGSDRLVIRGGEDP